jgi:hypothetical protein
MEVACPDCGKAICRVDDDHPTAKWYCRHEIDQYVVRYSLFSDGSTLEVAIFDYSDGAHFLGIFKAKSLLAKVDKRRIETILLLQ